MSNNTFSTSLVLSEMLCERVPNSLNMIDAAATPLVFLTAMYSLIDVGRLEEGQVSETESKMMKNAVTDPSWLAVCPHP